MLSNRIIANVVLRNLDLHFQGNKSDSLIYLENPRAIAKMRHRTFREVDISHRMAPLRKLCSVTLTFIFTLFLLCICYKKNCACSVCSRQICLDPYGPRCRVAFVNFVFNTCDFYGIKQCIVILTNFHDDFSHDILARIKWRWSVI